MEDPQPRDEKPESETESAGKEVTELSEKDMESLAGGWADPKPGKGGGGN